MRLPHSGGFNVSPQGRKKLFLHKHFLFCSNDKDIPTLKTMATYSYCVALSLESVRIVSRYKVHKRLITAVAFKTLFCSQSLMGTHFLQVTFFKRTPMRQSASLTYVPRHIMRRYWNQCLVSLTIGTAMSLPSPGVKFTGINLAWEITGNHTSCCMKLVRTIVVTKSTQLDLASGWARIAPRECGCRMEFGSEFRLGKKLHSVPEIVEDQNGAPRLDMSRDNPCVVQHPHY